jgi:hypothetical protein
VTGPRARISARALATISGLSRAASRTPFHWCSYAMRHRNSGCRSTGCSEASWPQYSNTFRLAHSQRLSAVRS